MFSRLIECITASNVDIAVCEHIHYWTEEKQSIEHIVYDKNVAKYSELVGAILRSVSNRKQKPVGGIIVCNKLFHRSCFDGIRFDLSLQPGEDFWAYMQILSKHVTCAFCREPLYYYRKRESSIMSQSNLESHAKLSYENCKRIMDLFEDDQVCYRYALEGFVGRMFTLANYYAMSNRRQAFLELYTHFMSYWAVIEPFHGFFSLKYRFGLSLLKISPKLFWYMDKIRNTKYR